MNKATEEKVKRLLLRLHRLHGDSFTSDPMWWNAFRQTATDVDDLLRQLEPNLAPEVCCKQQEAVDRVISKGQPVFAEMYIG